MHTITINAEIPSQNDIGGGRNWRVRAARIRVMRANWKYLVANAMRCHGIDAATGPRRLHIVAYRRRLCADIANLIGGAKHAVDGMVDAGLLVDDRDSLAKITYEQHVRSEHPENRTCTVLHISDITTPDAGKEAP